MSISNIVTSQNGKLVSGTKQDNIDYLLSNKTFKNEESKQKAINKRIQLFEKYDENSLDYVRCFFGACLHY